MPIGKHHFKISNAQISAFTDEINKQLEDNFGKEVMERRMLDAIEVIKDDAQDMVPLDSGATQDSWFQEVEVTDKYIKGVFGYDELGIIDYIPLIHANVKGTVFRTEKNPNAQDRWLAKSVQMNTDKVVNILKGDD